MHITVGKKLKKISGASPRTPKVKPVTWVDQAPSAPANREVRMGMVVNARHDQINSEQDNGGGITRNKKFDP